MDRIEEALLEQIAELHGVPEGAYNIRVNGQLQGRSSSANIEIVSKTDNPGIDIIVKPGTKNEKVHIPVLVTNSGVQDMVYNDFFIGEDCDVIIVAGCGIHNCGELESRHDGIHTFHVGKNARVRYIEKHYGEGEGTGENVMNPTTVIELEEGAYMELDTMQIKGIDNTVRRTEAVLKGEKSKLVVKDKVFTHDMQKADAIFKVELNGENCTCDLTSRAIAKNNSIQTFEANIAGNAPCASHTECDAIIMDDAKISASPQIVANDLDAALIHEATIGKIAGEQLIKLMTLGLTEEEAEEQIIAGFLR